MEKLISIALSKIIDTLLKHLKYERFCEDIFCCHALPSEKLKCWGQNL